jgi:penicillin amidase
MDQAKNFEEFRAACNYSNIPGENMIWADKMGNIGWQAVGIAPVRRNWSGLLPVPGDGSHEWDGYLPIVAKPNVYNPESGIFSTANQNVTPLEYKIWDAIGFSWSDPYRGDRVEEVLHSGKKFTVHDLAKLQTDYYSLPARILVPMLENLEAEETQTKAALQKIKQWETYSLDVNSIEAAIYVEWENVLKQEVEKALLPKEALSMVNMQLFKVISFLAFPDGNFGTDPVKGRDEFLIRSFSIAINNLEKRLGTDQSKWQYGQVKNKHIKLSHALGDLVSPDLQKKLNVGPHPRGGNAYTVGSSGGNYNQSSGASFKVVIDTGNWDESLFMNSPGQSGNPDSPFYKNLFDHWAKDKYLPLFYTKSKIQSTAAQKILLKPTR